MLTDQQLVRNNFYSLLHTDRLATLLLDLLWVLLGIDHLVFIMLVSLVLCRDHWPEVHVLLSWLGDHDQQLVWVSLLSAFGKSQPGREAVDLVRLQRTKIEN